MSDNKMPILRFTGRWTCNRITVMIWTTNFYVECPKLGMRWEGYVIELDEKVFHVKNDDFAPVNCGKAKTLADAKKIAKDHFNKNYYPGNLSYRGTRQARRVSP